MGRVQIIVLIVAVLLLGYFLGISSSRPEMVAANTSSIPAPSRKPLSFLTDVETPRGTVHLLIDQDYIYFNPYESAVNNATNINIEKKNYPKLFSQGIANSSTLIVKSYKDPSSSKDYIKLSNNQPDHGGYAEVYSLLVNPFSGEIKELK